MTGLSFGHGRHPKHQVYIRQPAGVLIIADAGSVHEACSDPACNIPFAHASHPLVKQLVTGSRASKPGIAHDARGALLSVRAAGGNLWASTGGQMVRGCAVLSSIVLLMHVGRCPSYCSQQTRPIGRRLQDANTQRSITRTTRIVGS
jgi:hypothetical protein